jgi:hypothetical protein
VAAEGIERARRGALRWAALVAGAYLALGAAYLLCVPIFEAPDEPSHIEHLGFVHQTGRFPTYDEDPDVPGEGMQAPLYYGVAAPLYGWVVREEAALLAELHRANLALYKFRPDAARENQQIAVLSKEERRGQKRRLAENRELDGLVHLRWPSLAFGLASVLLTFAAVRTAFGDERLAALAAALLGLNPQFLFVSSYVSNDAAAAAVGAASLWVVAHALAGGGPLRRHYFLAAGLVLVGLSTKTSTLPVTGAAALAVYLGDPRPLGVRVRDAALAGGAALALGAPYFVWIAELRGDPLGVTAVWHSAVNRPGPERYGGAFAYFTGEYWNRTFKTYWGRFGWATVSLPAAAYRTYLALCAVGLLGFVLSLRARARQGGRLAVAAHLVVAAALMLSTHVWLNLQTAAPQGRHLFPAAPHVAAILALGLAHLGSRLGPSAAAGATLALIAALAGLALHALVGVLVPAYA